MEHRAWLDSNIAHLVLSEHFPHIPAVLESMMPFEKKTDVFKKMLTVID